MKIVKQRMSTIKVGRGFELYHQSSDILVSGSIERQEDGFHLLYERPNANLAEESKYINILLSVEKNLDREDLDNVNEILEAEGFSFVKFK